VLSYPGIIVSAYEIIQSALAVVVIAAVAYGVDFCDIVLVYCDRHVATSVVDDLVIYFRCVIIHSSVKLKDTELQYSINSK